MLLTKVKVLNVGSIEEETIVYNSCTLFAGRNYTGKTIRSVDIITLALYGTAVSKDSSIYEMITTGRDSCTIELTATHDNRSLTITRTATVSASGKKSQQLSIVEDQKECNQSGSVTRGQKIIDEWLCKYEVFCTCCVMLPSSAYDILLASRPDRRDLLLNMIEDKGRLEKEHIVYSSRLKSVSDSIKYINSMSYYDITSIEKELEQLRKDAQEAQKNQKEASSNNSKLQYLRSELGKQQENLAAIQESLRESCPRSIKEPEDIKQVNETIDQLDEIVVPFLSDRTDIWHSDLDAIPYDKSNCPQCPLYNSFLYDMELEEMYTREELEKTRSSCYHILSDDLKSYSDMGRLRRTLGRIADMQARKQRTMEEIEEMERNIEQLEKKGCSPEVDTPYTLEEATSNLAHINRRIGKVRSEIDRCNQHNVEVKHKKEKCLPYLQQKERNLDLLVKATSSKGIMLSLVTEAISQCESDVNKILARVITEEKITTSWQLDKVSGRDAIEVKAGNRSVTTYSGAQLKTMRLACKYSLSHASGLSLLLIDELPDGLDTNTLRNYTDFIRSIVNEGMQVVTASCNPLLPGYYRTEEIHLCH
jgi:DNA repair exonuclease SbcCD ATPase subunit